MQVKHLIMTRFNIECDKDIAFHGNDPEYLAQRFALFDRYCLPSVAAQTSRDFTWLVLFHPQTPEPFRTQIAHYQELYPFFRPVYTDVKEDINVLVAEIGVQYAGDAEWLLTTRLDNDDMLHRDYVKRLREEVDANPPKERTFYSFVHGTRNLVHSIT